MTYIPVMTHKRACGIVNDLRVGRSVEDLAVQHGLSEAYICKIAHKHGISARPTPNTPPPSNKSVWVILADLIQTRLLLTEIGNKHGVSKQRVHQVFMEARIAGVMFPNRKYGGVS